MEKEKKVRRLERNGTIILRNPIMINGVEHKELKYDTDEITASMFTESAAKSGKKGSGFSMIENDYGIHLYLGFSAIIAINQFISYEDLERIKGADIAAIMQVGRNFTLQGWAEQSQLEDLGKQSENTQESSTQV